MSQRSEDPHNLEPLLRAVRFRPPASLEGEIHWRMRKGELPQGSRAERVRRILGIAAALTVAVGALAVWKVAREAAPARLVDRCCLDLDGGGSSDDGLLILSRGGADVRRLAVYEDRDHSRSYTPGDPILFERSSALTLSGPIEAGSRTTEFCCLDYDGGGANDDALVIVARPPDQISMAAIYETSSSPGAPRMLR